MADVVVKNLKKSLGSVDVIHGVDLTVEHGEFLVLVGPSGCGKSTLLRMIAGLEAVTSGDIFIGDKFVNDLPPARRDIAMVFQSYALYPHKTVEANMSFALKIRRMDKAAIRVCKQCGRNSWAGSLPGSFPPSPLGRSTPACCHGPGDRAGPDGILI